MPILEGNVVSCCSHEQAIELIQQMNMAAGLLLTCPTCWIGFRQNFCKMTCSPEQSKYLQVTSTQDYEDGEDNWLVKLLHFDQFKVFQYTFHCAHVLLIR